MLGGRNGGNGSCGGSLLSLETGSSSGPSKSSYRASSAVAEVFTEAAFPGYWTNSSSEICLLNSRSGTRCFGTFPGARLFAAGLIEIGRAFVMGE